MLESAYKAMSCYKFQISDYIQTASFTRQPSLPATIISLLLKNRRTCFLGRGEFQHCGTHRRGGIKEGRRTNVEPGAPPDFADSGLRVEINKKGLKKLQSRTFFCTSAAYIRQGRQIHLSSVLHQSSKVNMDKRMSAEVSHSWMK